MGRRGRPMKLDPPYSLFVIVITLLRTVRLAVGRGACVGCNRHFFPGADHPMGKGEEALRMYSNGREGRVGVLRVPHGAMFSWVERYGRSARNQWTCGVRLG